MNINCGFDEWNYLACLIALPYYLQTLADGVIPNEYGINPKQKLKIGSKVNSFCKASYQLLFLLKVFECFTQNLENFEWLEKSSARSIDLYKMYNN